MAKRCIYFCHGNQLYKKTIEVNWDMDSIKVNKVMCSEEIYSSAEKFMQPCIDVSSASSSYIARQLSTFNVKDEQGNSIHNLWKVLDNHENKDMLPPGSYDIVYLKNLSEKQISLIVSAGSFYDLYHNPEKQNTSSAKACAALQLLFMQGKLEYIDDMNKFMHWYMMNCYHPLEWVDT